MRAFSPCEQSERQDETDSEGNEVTGGAPTGALELYGEPQENERSEVGLARRKVMLKV